MRHMTRTMVLATLAAGALPLAGCVYAAAAGALGSVVDAAGSGGEREAPDPAAARQACSERALRHGTVRIIDVVERSEGIRVYGTVETARHRRAFECDFRGGGITGFHLRRARPLSG